MPETRPAAQSRPASSRQQAGDGTTGRCSSGRTRGHGWRIAGRGLVTGGFLLCGWLVTSAGHAAAAETATSAAPHHDLIATASRLTGSAVTRHARHTLPLTAGLRGTSSPGSQRPASTLLAVPGRTGQPGAGAGNHQGAVRYHPGKRVVSGLGGLTRPAAVSPATRRLAGTLDSAVSSATAASARATSATTTAAATLANSSAPSASPSCTPLAALPVGSPTAALPVGSPTAALPVGSPAAVPNLTGAIRSAVASLAAPLLDSLGEPATGGLVPGTATLPSLPALSALPSMASGPVASIPGAADVTTIVPAGVNPGGPEQPTGNLPGSHPLMRMAARPAGGPARTAGPAVTGTTLAPVPAAAAQQAAGWTRRAPQQYAGAQPPAVPHRTVPGARPGPGAATQTDPVPAGGAGAAQMAVQVVSRSGQPNPAGWLIRTRMSRSPAGLQRADDPAVSPD